MNRCCALVLALLTAPGAALAQDAGVESCDAPPLMGPDTTFPVDTAMGVSLDAPLRIHYTDGYFGPLGPGAGSDPTTLITVQRCVGFGCDIFSCEDGGTFVPGLVQVIVDELIFLPEGGGWDAAATYSGIARGRDGDRVFSFCTGSSTDDLPPVFGPLDEVTSDPIDPRCDAPEGGFRVGVFFAPATDTGPAASIEYLLFQTRGVGVDAPIVRNRVRNHPGSQITMAFTLSPDEASAPICVRVAAIDGVGHLTYNERSGDGRDECVDPVQGNFFYPLCSASPPAAVGNGSSRGLGHALAATGSIALLFMFRRRRRR